jgi:hypothetical protein
MSTAIPILKHEEGELKTLNTPLIQGILSINFFSKECC